MKKEKLIHVEFFTLPKGVSVSTRHHYFGSKTAIYETFSVEDIGISLSTLRCINLTTQPYANRHCIIRQGEVLRSTKH